MTAATTWQTALRVEWDRQDARLAHGLCPSCGTVDFVELGRDDDRAWRRCRVCGLDYAAPSRLPLAA